jgi:hypothetical protein
MKSKSHLFPQTLSRSARCFGRSPAVRIGARRPALSVRLSHHLSMVRRLELSVTVFAGSQHRYGSASRYDSKISFRHGHSSHRSDSGATPVDFKLHHHHFRNWLTFQHRSKWCTAYICCLQRSPINRARVGRPFISSSSPITKSTSADSTFLFKREASISAAASRFPLSLYCCPCPKPKEFRARGWEVSRGLCARPEDGPLEDVFLLP